MNDADLQRLARLCIAIDHLNAHGRHRQADRIALERDALLEEPQQSLPQHVPAFPANKKGKR